MIPSSDRQSSWGPPGPVPLLVVALVTALALVVFTALLATLLNGILNASLGHAALLHVPETSAAMGSATNNTARYLGSALGISLISIAITGGEGLFQGWHLAVIGTTIVSLVGAGVMIVMRRGGPA